jgi:hypothetical protein
MTARLAVAANLRAIVAALTEAATSAQQTLTWLLPFHPLFTDTDDITQDPCGIHGSIEKLRAALAEAKEVPRG